MPAAAVDSTIASELTLIIPLALLLVTLIWWGWLNHRQRNRSE